MKFAIAKLILWPRDETKEPRVITFAEHGINLVAGASRSGKSAIIKIIDYCLGSGGCNIPKMSPIRRAVAWYGIVVHTTEGYKVLARRDPGQAESTDDCMVHENADGAYPARPEKNANRDAVKTLLGRLTRLPQASQDLNDTGSGYKGRASFSDMTAFMFQPQSIVANDRILFYETDEEEHARKLREIFPLVLGAVDADTLVKQHRLAEVRRQLERRRRQLEVLRGSIKDYAGAIRGRFVGAVDLGLIQSDLATIDEAEPATLLARLKDVVAGWNDGRRLTAGTPSADASPRLAQLRQRESEVAARAASTRLRHVQLRELSQARQVSESILGRERDRLGPASWLMTKVSDTVGPCPFCGSENHGASEELSRLKERTASVEAQWRGIATIPPMLDAEEIEVRKALSTDEESLRQVRSERTQLERLSETVRKADEDRVLFVGRLSEFLIIERALAGDGELAREIADLETEEGLLRREVDNEVIAQRKEDALLLISRYAGEYGRIVELENNDGIIKLDTKELTVRILSGHESAWLYQLGSGANYLGYHVATFLALHEFFISRPIPYVPSLLILDQPSQTQFPDELDDDAEQEELLAVHKAFMAFDVATKRTNHVLQVIVSEHAGRRVYEGIDNVHIIARWRHGRKLVPWDWDSEALDAMNGKRADYAFEDIRDTVVLNALNAVLGSHEIVDRIDLVKATFAQRTILFEVTATLSQPPTPAVDEGAPRPPPLPRRVSGTVRQDLSVTFSLPLGATNP